MTTTPGSSGLRAAITASVLALAGGGAFTSCFLSGYEKVDDATGSGGASSTSSGATVTAGTTTSQGSSGGDDLPRCETTETPPRPTDAATEPELDRWFALRAIRLGDPGQPASVPGLDLDDADTCNDSCQSEPECAEPAFLMGLDEDQAQARCDFPRGVDNSGVYLFDLALSFVGQTEGSLSEQADAGEWSLLLRVQDWNGTEDDGTVTVSLYSTPGFVPPTDGPTSTSASSGAGGAEPVLPAWDGNDRWYIDGRSVVDGNLDSPAFHASGYVSESTLVADLSGDFFVGSVALPIQLASGRLIAPLVIEEDEPTVVRGATFAGRWSVDDLLQAIGTLVTNGQRICDQGVFRTVAQQTCRLVDVRVDQNLDDCDGLSIGIGLDGDLVLPGEVVPPPGEGGPCQVETCESYLAEP